MPKVSGFTALCVGLLLAAPSAFGQQRKPSQAAELSFPPKLPDGKAVVTDTSPRFLSPPADLRPGVTVAQQAPTVDFLYYPRQNYPGQPWANWGDSLAVGDKYYASISDHLALGVKGDGSHGTGNAFVFEYDPAAKSVRLLAETSKVLALPAGHYTPGKIHGRLDLGNDGWLYYATHRGSVRATTDANHYRGDWILRTHPGTGESEVLAHGPVPRHAMPTSILDPERLILYCGTAAGQDAANQEVHFLAFDTRKRKVLYSGPDGPGRAIMFAKSTGRVYYTAGKAGVRDGAPLMRFHPDEAGGKPVQVRDHAPGLRAATAETDDGKIYAVSQAAKGSDSTLWEFDVRTETVKVLGPAPVASQTYVASLDVDPTGRYLYYVPGAHGGSHRDNAAVVQYDLTTQQRKVIAFLHPFYQDQYGAGLRGTYSTAISPQGDKLYVTWNINRGSKAWDSCGLTVIHIPESERR